MKIKDFIQIAITELSNVYDRQEATAIIYLLLAHKLNKRKGEIPLMFEYELQKDHLVELNRDISYLKSNYPIQYLMGTTQFLEFDLYTVEGVFIPRPETEELVVKLLGKIKNIFDESENIRILDIGTGTGNIAIALAYYLPNSRVLTIDKSWVAISTAMENAQKYQLLDRITFECGDIFKYDFAGKDFDVIVSNPPYVPRSDYEHLPDNVRRYEPLSALFAPDDTGLSFYELIFNLSEKLKPRIIGAEIYEEHSDRILKIAGQHLQQYQYNIGKDLNNKDRFFFAEKMIKRTL